MDDFTGRVVLITGGARGQGRSHAVAFAERGADVVLVDRCEDREVLGRPMATKEDLAETVRLVEAAGARCLATRADVADRAALDEVVARAPAEFGGHGITVNAIAPGNIATAMLHNDALFRHLRPDLENPDDVEDILRGLHAQPVAWLDPAEITRAVLFFTAETAAHVSGTVLPVDAGNAARVTA